MSSLVSPGDRQLPDVSVMTPAGGGGGGGGGAVTSVFGRTGDVLASNGDYSFSQIAGSVAPAQLPIFTSGAPGAVPAPGAAPATYVLQANGTWAAVPSGTTVSGTPPASPVSGQLWWDNVGGQLYVWIGSQWVAASCCAGGGGGGSLSPIPNQTVLGNVSGATALPVALTRPQLTQLASGIGLDIRDFGGVADGVTDNTAALAAAMATLTTSDPLLPSGPRIRFPAAAQPYHFAGTINLQKCVILEGDSTHQGITGVGVTASIVSFPASTTGFIVNRPDTFGNGTLVTNQTGADGTCFRNLTIVGGGGTLDQTGQQAGIWCRATTIIENCAIDNFPGDGLRIVATVGAGGALEGQASGCNVDVLVINRVGRHGVYIQGGDANATSTNRINVHTCGCSGVLDKSFLSSLHKAIQCDSPATSNLGTVTYGGTAYQLISDNGDGGTTTPGTNDAVWYPIGPASGFTWAPAWSSGGTYIVSCPIITTGPNSAIQINNPYIESGNGVCHAAQNTTVYNPAGDWTRFSNVFSTAPGEGTRVTTFDSGLFNTSYYTDGTGATQRVISGLGENNASGTTGTWLYYRDSLYWPQPLRWQKFYGTTDPDLYLAVGNLASEIVSYIPGAQTTWTFGTGTPQPFIQGFPILGVGWFATARRQTTGSAPPSSGTWAQGDFCWNINTTAGGILGWSCTVTGTPGTWSAVTPGGGGGGVSSVAMTVPSGLAVSGSPITTSGTFGVTWSGTIPATSLPNPSATTLGGTQSGTAPANNFMTGISTAGVPTFAQPAFSNLSGSVTAAQMPAFTGDVTSPAGSTVNTIAAGAVTLAKMAPLAANTVIGNNTGSAATPIALTQTQLTAMVQTFTSALSGAVPASGANNTTGFYLSGAGTYVAIPGGSTGANPTGTVGLTAVNGSLTTFMRSDAAPPLSQAIAPTWTAAHIFTSTGPQVTLGAAGGNAGNLALKGSTSGTVTVQPGAAAAGTYNFNLPTTAGTAGQVLTSQGGLTAAMTWTTAGTGTVTSVAMTVPAGLAVSGSPISGSGTFAVTWSGTIPASSLPNPSATTLGGTQSGTAPANQFMTGISTAGVPTFAQPAFSNLSGSATLAQLPSIANNTVLGNVSGATAVPAALTQAQLTALINVFSSTLSGAVPSSSGQPANSLLGANGTWQGGSVQAGTPPSSPIDGQLWWDNVGGQLYVAYGGVWVAASCCGGGSGSANPTATIGLTAVNGTLATYMRSDAAPPLSQAIAPTWTAAHIWTGAGPQITLGATGGNSGSLAYKGSTSGTITVQPQAAAGTYNFNLPTTAGTAGQVLTSQGGGSNAMTWTTGGGGSGISNVTMQVFTASGTYTPTSGMKFAIVECIGGGGGGGVANTGSATLSGGAGGGGEGGYSRSVLTAATIGSSQTVTIGAGGASATAGGNTSLGTLVIANGGSAGQTFTTTSSNWGNGGAGGTVGTGQVTWPGQAGSNGLTTYYSSTNFIAFGGRGGGRSAVVTAVANAAGAIGASAAANTGAGGNGGAQNGNGSSFAGGVGGSGICIITEYQ